jgi:hypothetical protein
MNWISFSLVVSATDGLIRWIWLTSEEGRPGLVTENSHLPPHGARKLEAEVLGDNEARVLSYELGCEYSCEGSNNYVGCWSNKRGDWL